MFTHAYNTHVCCFNLPNDPCNKCCSCVSQPNITVFGVCTPYLEGRGNLYLGRTTPTINVISSIFEGIDSSSDCVQDLRKLVCFLAFPICQQSLGKPLPLPLCKEACDLAGEGRCQLEGNASQQLRDLLTVNCGGPVPIAGDQPECIMIAGGLGWVGRVGRVMWWEG